MSNFYVITCVVYVQLAKYLVPHNKVCQKHSVLIGLASRDVERPRENYKSSRHLLREIANAV